MSSVKVAVIATAIQDPGRRQAFLDMMKSGVLREEVALYRALHPKSRAVDHTTYAGSTGCVRRRTCIYCRALVATSSAKWRETAASKRAAVEHGQRCAAEYLREVVGVEG